MLKSFSGQKNRNNNIKFKRRGSLSSKINLQFNQPKRRSKKNIKSQKMDKFKSTLSLENYNYSTRKLLKEKMHQFS